MKIETRNFNELVGETTTFTRALRKKIKKKLRIDFIATTKGGNRKVRIKEFVKGKLRKIFDVIVPVGVVV